MASSRPGGGGGAGMSKVRFRTCLRNTIYDALRSRPGWTETDSDVDFDFVWADVPWMRENFDGLHLKEHQRVNHFRNHYELTRKDLMVKNLKRITKQMVREDKQAEAKVSSRRPSSAHTMRCPGPDITAIRKYVQAPDALELAETAQRESNSLRLALQRAQEEAATLRLCVRFAETASIRGAAGAGTGSCAETVRQRISSTFRAQEAQRKAEAWEAEVGTLRREVARLGDKLADAEREGCEQRERAEQEQVRARKLREINLGLEQLLEAVEAPSLRETKLSALLAVLRGDILKLNKELQDVKAVAGQWDRTPGLYHSQLHHPRALPSEPRSESLGPPHSALSRSSQIRLETQSRLLESFRRNLQHLD